MVSLHLARGGEQPNSPYMDFSRQERRWCDEPDCVSSRNAILSVMVFFIVGALLLTRVDVAEGQRVAREADRGLQEA